MQIRKIRWMILLTFLFATACWAQTPAPQPDKTLTVAGLQSPVTVRRDGRGIPYIEAKNAADLFFAQGYVTAQDRLWQMDLYRRVARGETAEIFGRQVLEEDKRWRTFGFARVAEQLVENASPENRAALENYARGVNAYIASLDPKALPVEFQILQYSPRPWTPADSMVVSKIFDDALSSTWRFDVMKAALMNLPPEKRARVFEQSSPLDVLLIGKDDLTAESIKNTEKNKRRESSLNNISQIDFLSGNSAFSAAKKINEIENARKNSLERIGFFAEELAASNNWVVSGKRTVDGKPLLANDPHLRNTQPPIWYLVHLASPAGTVAGVSTPGIPGVIIGHNEHVAWGSTNVGPDVQDLYVETFNAEGKYKTPSGWETPVIRREEIKVRNNPLSPQTVSETLDVRETRNGVIVLEEAGKRYALKWTAFDPKNDLLSAFSALAGAKNWNDFRSALRNYAGPMQNFVYADREGNIGWIAAGKVPIRRTGDGSLPYDGSTDEGAWTGFIPFEELPQLYNPPAGFIVTANQRTVGKSYKYHDLIARAHTVSRAKRLENLLASKAKVSVEDMQAFQFDTYSEVNARFVREVVNLKAASDETLKLLTAWDGRMNADSKAAIVADTMRGAFRNKILTANLPAAIRGSAFMPYEAAFFDRLIAEKPQDWLPKEYASYADLLRASERDARETLTRQMGADEAKWTWGERVKSTFPHPLAAAPLIGLQFAIDPLPQNGSSGSGASPNVGSAVSMRFITAPGNWDATLLTLPTGQSGDRQSPHYKDQLDAWYTGKTPIFPFTPKAVQSAAKETLLFKPQ